MKYRTLTIVFLAAVSLVGCRVLPQQPLSYNEDVVLRVWDALDVRYGSKTFFECEYLPVLDGKIEIVKPYAVSDIAVVAYFPRANRTTFFRPVPSNPGEKEFVVEGTVVHFNPRHENRSFFVAWIPDLSGTEHDRQRQKDGFCE